jgi:hypothetical protein
MPAIGSALMAALGIATIEPPGSTPSHRSIERYAQPLAKVAFHAGLWKTIHNKSE